MIHHEDDNAAQNNSKRSYPVLKSDFDNAPQPIRQPSDASSEKLEKVTASLDKNLADAEAQLIKEADRQATTLSRRQRKARPTQKSTGWIYFKPS
jgi:hypothetical protein